MVDPDRGPNSEHLLHHFHELVYRAVKGGPGRLVQAAE